MNPAMMMAMVEGKQQAAPEQAQAMQALAPQEEPLNIAPQSASSPTPEISKKDIESLKKAMIKPGSKIKKDDLDLAPLAALTDAWTGSDFSSAIKQQKAIDAKKELMRARKGAGGAKPLTQNMIKKINEGNAIPGILSNVSGLIDQNAHKFGPFAGRAGQMNPYDTEAQVLDSEMRAKSQAFGRFMEGGVLRKEDEEKYRKMFPQLKDTPETAQGKLRIINDLLAERQQSDIKAFEAQGYDLTGLNMPAPTSRGKSGTGGFDSMSDQDLLKAYQAAGGR